MTLIQQGDDDVADTRSPLRCRGWCACEQPAQALCHIRESLHQCINRLAWAACRPGSVSAGAAGESMPIPAPGILPVAGFSIRRSSSVCSSLGRSVIAPLTQLGQLSMLVLDAGCLYILIIPAPSRHRHVLADSGLATCQPPQQQLRAQPPRQQCQRQKPDDIHEEQGHLGRDGQQHQQAGCQNARAQEGRHPATISMTNTWAALAPAPRPTPARLASKATQARPSPRWTLSQITRLGGVPPGSGGVASPREPGPG